MECGGGRQTAAKKAVSQSIMGQQRERHEMRKISYKFHAMTNDSPLTQSTAGVKGEEDAGGHWGDWQAVRVEHVGDLMFWRMSSYQLIKYYLRTARWTIRENSPAESIWASSFILIFHQQFGIITTLFSVKHFPSLMPMQELWRLNSGIKNWITNWKDILPGWKSCQGVWIM